LQQARLSLGSLRDALRRADRGRAVARPYAATREAAMAAFRQELAAGSDRF
jgi:hypothetical protein